MILELFLVALVLIGGFFCFIAGLGVLRLPDVLVRMHASTKAGTLGSGLILVAVAVLFADLATVTRAVATIVFLLITAPVAAHMIGRAAFRSGVAMWKTKIEDGAEDALRRRELEPGKRAFSGPFSVRKTDARRDACCARSVRRCDRRRG